MIEGRDENGYSWVQNFRYDEYYYLKDFEHLVVMKVTDPHEHWEAAIFEDEKCQKVIGREEFATKKEAQDSLENYMEITIKNRKLHN